MVHEAPADPLGPIHVYCAHASVQNMKHMSVRNIGQHMMPWGWTRMDKIPHAIFAYMFKLYSTNHLFHHHELKPPFILMPHAAREEEEVEVEAKATMEKEVKEEDD